MKKIHEILQENEKVNKTADSATTMCILLDNAIRNYSVEYISEEEAKEDAKAGMSFENVVVDKKEYLCVLPSTLLKMYERDCRSRRIVSQYRTTRDISVPLKKENLLFIKEEGGKYRASHKINGSTNERFLWIRKSEMSRLCKAYKEF